MRVVMHKFNPNKQLHKCGRVLYENLKIKIVKVKSPTSAFCLGDTRQQMTDAQSTANAKNWCFISSSKVYVRVFPSIINANAA